MRNNCHSHASYTYFTSILNDEITCEVTFNLLKRAADNSVVVRSTAKRTLRAEEEDRFAFIYEAFYHRDTHGSKSSTSHW